jgi:hypothetical protein
VLNGGLLEAVSELVARLRLDEEGPFAPTRESLQPAAAALCAVIAPESALAPLAAAVHEAAGSLDDSDDVLFRFVMTLESFAARLARDTVELPAARAWWLSSRLSLLTEGARKFRERSPDARWDEMESLLWEIPCVALAADQLRRELVEIGGPAEGATPALLAEEATPFLQEHEDALLAELLDRLLFALEARAREMWMRTCPDAASETPLDLFAYGWACLLPNRPAGLSGVWMLDAVQGCARDADLCELPEVAEYLDPPERIAYYALSYLLPPCPDPWVLHTAGDLERLFDAQMSRWYFARFRNRPSPLDLIASVLRAGRPLYYERPLAHVLVEHRVLASWLRPDDVSGEFFAFTDCLERNFSLMLDGYLLRQLAVPRLKTPAGWKWYLESLVDLHAGRVPGEVLASRKRFLAARGGRSPLRMLAALGESHERIQ